MSKFDSAVEIILSHEGGYVNDPKDPGGETKYGISKKAYPKLNIADLTRDEAKAIYKSDYWDKVRGDKLPIGIGIVMFDMAVNIGVKQTVKILQGILNVKKDGIFGDITHGILGLQNSAFIIEALTTERIRYYSNLPTWDFYKSGWIRRSVETMSSALLIRDYL